MSFSLMEFFSLLSLNDRRNPAACSPLCLFAVQAGKLRALLREAERRCEDLRAELSGQVLEVEHSRADMEELLQHNGRLQRDSEEHQTLKGAYNALLNRSGAESVRRHV